MIILLPLLRKLSIHHREILGRCLVVAGLVGVLVGLATVPGLVIVSAVTVIVGAVSLVSARMGRRAARTDADAPIVRA